MIKFAKLPVTMTGDEYRINLDFVANYDGRTMKLLPVNLRPRLEMGTKLVKLETVGPNKHSDNVVASFYVRPDLVVALGSTNLHLGVTDIYLAGDQVIFPYEPAVTVRGNPQEVAKLLGAELSDDLTS
jgi:hypothetical protein